MKIDIDIVSNDEGLTGGFNIALGGKSVDLLAKVREFLADPEPAISRVGEKIVNAVLGGGSRNKKSDTGGSEQGSEYAGF